MNNKQSKKTHSITPRYLAAFLFLCGLCINAAAQDVAVFPQLGHTDRVTSVAFSPDGKQILSCSGEMIKLWDATTGREIRTFSGRWATFSPDGKKVLSETSSSSSLTAKLWDTVTGQEQSTFSGHHVVFSPDGKQVLSFSGYYGASYNIKLSDTATGRELKTFSGYTAAFSPDGKQVLFSGSEDGTKLWDIATGREIRSFPDHTVPIESVAFSPNGKQVLTIYLDGILKVCDTVSGRELRTFEGYNSGGKDANNVVASVAFSPDGKQALSGSGEKTMELWDTTSGRVIRTFSGHTAPVWTVAFSPDGKQVLSGSWDKTIKLWDTASGKVIRTYEGHTKDVNSIVFSPDGKQILSYSGNGWNDNMKLWETATGRELGTFSGYTAEFSPDGKQFLSGSEGNTLKLWDTASGREIRTFSGHFEGVRSKTFSPDGKQILFLSGRYTAIPIIKLWDTATGRELRTFFGQTDAYATIVEFNLDGKQVFSKGNPSKFWDTATGRELITIPGDRATFSPDRKQLLSVVSGEYSWRKNIIKLWDTVTGRELRTFSGHTDDILSVAFSSDGKLIVSGSGDKTVKLWETSSGRLIRTYEGHTNNVYSVEFSPDGKQILSHTNSNIKLWDTATGREIKTFLENEAVFSPDGKQVLSRSRGAIKLWDTVSGRELKTFSGLSVKFSPDGKQFLSFSGDEWDEDAKIKLWDTATWREIKTFSGNEAVFSPDGKQILYRSGDNIKLWDTATGRELRTFLGHTDNVYSIEFSPSGKQILSFCKDGIKLWDTASGRELGTIMAYSIEFSPDGKQILSGSDDGPVRLWDVSTGKEIAQFIFFTDGEWICLTPDGFYNSSPNGDKYLNVRVGNNVYGIDQYRSTFYKPQIVEARLQGRSDPVQIATTIQDIADKVPPVVVIRNPENGAGFTANKAELSVSIVDQRQPIKTIQVLVNGGLVGGESIRGNISGLRGGDLEIDNTQIRLTGNQNRVEFKLPITLNPGTNRIEVIANNPYSEAKETVEVTYKPAAAEQNILPNLWILSIGVNRYDDTRNLPSLSYAVNDAREIINAFKAQEGKVFRKVNSLLIADGEAITPTRDNITDNFTFLKQAAQRDVVLLFIAGHGVNDDGGSFYFMPSDAGFNTDGSIRLSKAISYREILMVLDMSGQKLVFIDSCHSAGVSGRKTRGADNDKLVKAFKGSSIVILTASRGDQTSQESSEYKHGIFTYAIIQGMKGAADLYKDGKIKMKELDTYVSETVVKLTNGLQQPVTDTPDGYEDFVVAELK